MCLYHSAANKPDLSHNHLPPAPIQFVLPSLPAIPTPTHQTPTGLYSYKHVDRAPGNQKLRTMATKTFAGCICTLISSIVYAPLSHNKTKQTLTPLP